ncbi:MAG TPA: T9SS type A sorting domain-containing protein [Bacteroidia bacterium]|nr:T9SS type A sorting domain-containing protein [Bacteroidia bacterium]
MKKTVLMLMALGTWIYAGAQSSTNTKLIPTKAKPIHVSQTRQSSAKNDDPSFYKQSGMDKYNDKKHGGLNPEAAGPVHCGSAYNLYGVLDANTTAETYDSALGVILFTHREDNSKFATGGSGAYEASVSMDGGATWDTSRILFSNVTTRYPNGVIYNPAGNTVFTNAYWATMGPVAGAATTDVWTGWDSIAFGSMQFNGTNTSQTYKANGKPGVLVEEGIQYMTACDNGMVHSIGDGFHQSTSGYTYLGASVNTGTFNATNHNFDWTQAKVRPHLNPSDHTNTVFDSVPEFMNSSGTAWSQNGMVGYTVLFGNLDTINYVTYQPVIYKTIDGGTTWNMMPPHNWRNDPGFAGHLYPTLDSAVTYPLPRLYFNAGSQGGSDDYDLVVDKNNNLHIFLGLTSSALCVPDSSNYYAPIAFNIPSGPSGLIIDYIYDLSTTTSGGWNARFVDSLQSLPTEYVSNLNNWNSDAGGALAIGHRIQATRTTDGSKIFVTWLDDVTAGLSTSADSMQYPDIFGRGFDVTTGFATPIKKFTNTSDQYYICVSNKPIISGVSGSYNYQIPVVRVEAPGATNDGLNPVYFLYTDSVMYNDFDFNGIVPINAVPFTITQNYPNPCNGVTRFGVSLIKEGNVSVDVFNTVGQKMVSMNQGKMAPGSHTIAINTNGFATGVYFYRVTVDGSCLTQKMIVE